MPSHAWKALVPEDGNGEYDVFLQDLDTGVRKMISRRPDGGPLGNGTSNPPAISDDGGSVVWSTEASGVVADDDNESDDAFRYDVTARKSTLLSHEPSGRPLDAISVPAALDGQGTSVVLLSSWQRTGADWAIYRTDAAARSLTPLLMVGARPVCARNVVISADGSRIVFVTDAPLTDGDTDQTADLYVWGRGG